MEPDAKGPADVAFGRFRLLPHRRELLAEGQATGLGARAFDVLMALIEARGAVVGKDALAARVWPGQIVQDTALQSQVSALRAVLGADRDLIRTISGRGYQFVGEIRDQPPRRADADSAGRGHAAASGARGPPTNLPGPVSELIGRDKELSEVEDLAASHRLVTLTGTGGIGKTHLAMTAARRLMPRFGDGVWIVDFSHAVGRQPGSGHDRRGRRCCIPAGPSRGNTWHECLPPSRCCWCSIPASTWSAPWRPWPRNCCEPARRCMSSPPAVSRCAPRENGSIRCFLSPCRRKALATRTSSGMARCDCSSNGRERLCRTSHPIDGCSGDRGDLPAPRWHPSGDRTGRRAYRGT